MNIKGIPSRGFMEQGNWRVYVNPRPFDLNIEIYLTRSDGRVLQNATVKDGLIELQEIVDGEAEKYKPFLVLPGEVWQLLVDAMTDTTPPTKKERIEGELDATKYHLEDLRKLLKINL